MAYVSASPPAFVHGASLLASGILRPIVGAPVAVAHALLTLPALPLKNYSSEFWESSHSGERSGLTTEFAWTF